MIGTGSCAHRWFAPGRVNLVGEHTDYNGGPSIAFAIGLGVQATVVLRDDRVVQVTSAQAGSYETGLDTLEPNAVEGWACYPLGVVWVMRDVLATGLDIVVDGDVPAGAGLSSSAALTGAVAAAIDSAFRLEHKRDELIAYAIRAEREFVGVPCGGLDQRVSGHARAGSLLHHSGPTGAVRPVPMRTACRFVVVPLCQRHALADGRYAERRARCLAAAEALSVRALADIPIGDLGRAEAHLPLELRPLLRHVVTECERVRLAEALVSTGGDSARLGALVTESHRSLRDEFGASVPEADRLVDDLLADGVLGARIIGGGDGGSVLAVLDAADTDPRGGSYVEPAGGWCER